jgi:hypothetical protein
MLLKKLCYVSSSCQDLSSEELLGILTAARVNNARIGVTGMLLYHDGNFMQVLEGPPDVLDALYQRVCADPRHHGVIKLHEWYE